MSTICRWLGSLITSIRDAGCLTINQKIGSGGTKKQNKGTKCDAGTVGLIHVNATMKHS